MKKDLDRVDAKEAVFAENVKAKFSFQKLISIIQVTKMPVSIVTDFIDSHAQIQCYLFIIS